MESEREREKVLDPFFGRLLLDLMEINVREILHRLAIQILRAGFFGSKMRLF